MSVVISAYLTVFCDKILEVFNDASLSCYESGLSSIVHKIFDKKTGSYDIEIKSFGVNINQWVKILE